jgi:hypothetical protein
MRAHKLGWARVSVVWFEGTQTGLGKGVCFDTAPHAPLFVVLVPRLGLLQ